MIDIDIINKSDASEEEVSKCFSQIEPEDVILCRICPHAYKCRDVALKKIIKTIFEEQENQL